MRMLVFQVDCFIFVVIGLTKPCLKIRTVQEQLFCCWGKACAIRIIKNVGSVFIKCLAFPHATVHSKELQASSLKPTDLTCWQSKQVFRSQATISCPSSRPTMVATLGKQYQTSSMAATSAAEFNHQRECGRWSCNVPPCRGLEALNTLPSHPS